MNWPKEKRLEARNLYTEMNNIQSVSTAMDIPATTISRWCRDLTVGSHNEKSNRIEELRDSIRQDENFDLKKWAKDNGICLRTAKKYIRDIPHPLNNTLFSPFTQRAQNNPDRIKCRALYQEGKSYGQIFKETGISKSSISIWCRDLVDPSKRTRALSVDEEEALKLKVRELYLQNKTVFEVSQETGVGQRRIAEFCRDIIEYRLKSGTRLVSPKKKYRSYHQVLNDDQVLELRRTVRRENIKNWTIWSKKFGVSISVISMAARGITFKHLNVIEEPIPIDRMIPVRTPTRDWITPKIDEGAVAEIMALFKANPDKWDYTSIAEWMKERTGRSYKGNHIAVLFGNRDPHLELPKKRKYIPKNQHSRKPISRKIVSVEELQRRAEQKREEKESLRRFKEEANRYEREQKKRTKLRHR